MSPRRNVRRLPTRLSPFLLIIHRFRYAIESSPPAAEVCVIADDTNHVDIYSDGERLGTIIVSVPFHDNALVETVSRLWHAILIHYAINFDPARRKYQLSSKHSTASVYFFKYAVKTTYCNAVKKRRPSFWHHCSCGGDSFGLARKVIINADDFVVRECQLGMRELLRRAKAERTHLIDQRSGE